MPKELKHHSPEPALGIARYEQFAAESPDSSSEEDSFPQGPYTFVLIHGAWFTPRHWKPLEHQLHLRGHRTISPDLPAGDVMATFDDDAAAVEDAIGDEDNLFPVTHSRGVETLPRFLKRLDDLNHVIGATILSSGGPRDFKLKPLYPGEPELARHTDEFLAGIRSGPEEGLTTLDAEMAKNVILHDVTSERLVQRAVHNFRAQRTPTPNEAYLPELPPELPVFFVIGLYERVLELERARRAGQQLGSNVEVIEFPSGHAPQLSQPAKLAELLIRQANTAKHRRVSV
jgi:pimeloyl-ACP methyl ester carboxylesterase